MRSITVSFATMAALLGAGCVMEEDVDGGDVGGEIVEDEGVGELAAQAPPMRDATLGLDRFGVRCSVHAGDPALTCWGVGLPTAELSNAFRIAIPGRLAGELPLEIGYDIYPLVRTNKGRLFVLERNLLVKVPIEGVADLANYQFLTSDGKLWHYSIDSKKIYRIAGPRPDQPDRTDHRFYPSFLHPKIPIVRVKGGAHDGKVTRLNSGSPGHWDDDVASGSALPAVKLVSLWSPVLTANACYVDTSNKLFCRGQKDVLGYNPTRTGPPRYGQQQMNAWTEHPWQPSDPVEYLSVKDERLCVGTRASATAGLKLYCAGLPIGEFFNPNRQGETGPYLFDAFRPAMELVTNWPTAPVHAFEYEATDAGAMVACVRLFDGTLQCLGDNHYRSNLVGTWGGGAPGSRAWGKLSLWKRFQAEVTSFAPVLSVTRARRANIPNGKIQVVGHGRFFGDDNHTDLVTFDPTSRTVRIYAESPYVGAVGGPFVLIENMAAGWSIVATADFNRDGWTDIVWQHSASRKVVVWYMAYQNNQPTKIGNKQLAGGPPSNGSGENWWVVGAGEFTVYPNPVVSYEAPDLYWRDFGSAGKNMIAYYDAANNRVALRAVKAEPKSKGMTFLGAGGKFEHHTYWLYKGAIYRLNYVADDLTNSNDPSQTQAVGWDKVTDSLPGWTPRFAAPGPAFYLQNNAKPWQWVRWSFARKRLLSTLERTENTWLFGW